MTLLNSKDVSLQSLLLNEYYCHYRDIDFFSSGQKTNSLSKESIPLVPLFLFDTTLKTYSTRWVL